MGGAGVTDQFFFHVCPFCARYTKDVDRGKVEAFKGGGHDCSPLPGDRTMTAGEEARFTYNGLRNMRGVAVL